MEIGAEPIEGGGGRHEFQVAGRDEGTGGIMFVNNLGIAGRLAEADNLDAHIGVFEIGIAEERIDRVGHPRVRRRDAANECRNCDCRPCDSKKSIHRGNNLPSVPRQPKRFCTFARRRGLTRVPESSTIEPMNLPPTEIAKHVILLNDNAGWCWFQGERAIIHAGKLYFGSVATRTGADGHLRSGNIELTQYEIATQKVITTVLHEHFQEDDHDTPAVHVRQDGRIVAVYTKHSTDSLKRWRVSESPEDITSMGPEQTLEMPSRVCYSNVYRLSAEANRVYDFNRSADNNPCFNISDDDGLTWRVGGKLLDWPRPIGDPKYTGLDGTRPYVRFASNGVDQIHVIATEDHPRAYDNSIYHGNFSRGQLHDSFGKPIGGIAKPNQLTKVFEGDADHVAWTTDIRVDAKGLPYIIFSVQMNDAKHRADPNAGGDDLRFYYGRFDGTRWHVHPLAHAGSCLYAGENDYTGLAALHPYRSDIVYFSTNADPQTGEPLISRAGGKRHYEVFRGQTSDQGKTWTFAPLTQDSKADNLRPIVPPGDPSKTIVLWCRGTLRSYMDYTLEAVAWIDPLK